MTPTFRWKVFWLAAAVVGCLVLVLLLLPAKPPPRTLDFRLVGQPQITNGTMLISFVLSNGTSRSLNVVDDTTGNPFLVLDAGTGGDPPGSGNLGLGLGFLANSLELNLAPRAALTNAVSLTNPPPRFRLLVEVRDLAAERQRAVMQLLRFLVAKATLGKLVPRVDTTITLPASPWIEGGNSSAKGQPPTRGENDISTNASVPLREAP